jgi:hypothetical protein
VASDLENGRQTADSDLSSSGMILDNRAVRRSRQSIFYANDVQVETAANKFSTIDREEGQAEAADFKGAGGFKRGFSSRGPL